VVTAFHLDALVFLAQSYKACVGRSKNIEALGDANTWQGAVAFETGSEVFRVIAIHRAVFEGGIICTLVIVLAAQALAILANGERLITMGRL
tara:strand:+ start:847 stop:1122 length:276 start_codon:yes stop_codon:yes gene_type:complete